MAPPDRHVSYFAATTARARHVRFGINQRDRLSHLYVIGKTGVGKSTLLRLLACEDLAAGRGFALVDPHGELAAALRPYCPASAIYIDPTDPMCPFGYNPLRRVRDDRIPLAASGLLETFRKLWPDAWGVRMEHVLRNSLYALLERDGSTLPDVLRLYADDAFRKAVTGRVRNEAVRAFWKTEFEQYPARYRLEVTAPIQNKLGAILSDPALRRVVAAPAVDLHFRVLMDEGAVAEDAAYLAQEFQPVFGVEDLINLPNRHFYLKLMIDGSPSRPFSARTLDAGG